MQGGEIDSSISLYSPEMIERLVQERVSLRDNFSYQEADRIRTELLSAGVELLDIPFKQGGGSTWKYIVKTDAIPPAPIGRKAIYPKSLMDLAHNAYQWLQAKMLDESDIVSMCHEFLQQSFVPDPSCNNSTTTATTSTAVATTTSVATSTAVANNESIESGITIYRVALSRDMQGRKFADAAFEFAMAGVSDDALFAALAQGAEMELKRYGLRKSCR